MIKKNKKIKALGLLVVFVVLMSCSVFAGEKISVTTTIMPLAFFIEEIGGPHVDVNVMIAENGNPHAYEPTPGQMRALSKSEFYVKLGSGIEFELAWMEKLRALNRDMKVVDAAKGVQLIPLDMDYDDHGHNRYHGEMDPHIWLSLDNAEIIIGNIRNALVDFAPEKKDVFTKNAADLVFRLDALKRYAKERLNGLENKTFFIYHPVLGYLAKDFHLNQVAAEHLGKEPTPRQLNTVIRQANEVGVKTVFVSQQFSRKSAEAVAREIEGRVVVINPLSKNYMESMRQIIEAIAESMP